MNACRLTKIVVSKRTVGAQFLRLNVVATLTPQMSRPAAGFQTPVEASESAERVLGGCADTTCDHHRRIAQQWESH